MEQITVKFTFLDKETSMKFKKTEKLKSIFNKFAQSQEKSINDLFFFHKGENIPSNSSQRIISLQDPLDKQKNRDKAIYISVVPLNDENSKDGLKMSPHIICPKCKEHCLINMKNYKISLNGCFKDHQTNDILLPDFPSSQYMIESLVKCGLCSSHKGKTLNNRFYTCSCGINLCPSCIFKHKMPDHNVIDYDTKYFFCLQHKEKFNSYCVNCFKNLCSICESEHDNEHRIVIFDEVINDEIVNEIKDTQKDFKLQLDLICDQIKTMIEVFQKMLETLNGFYDINDKIFQNYDKENRNYEIIQNVLKININLSDENEVYQNITKILNEKKFEKKMKHVLRLYTKIYGEDDIYPPPETENVTERNINPNNINTNINLRSVKSNRGKKAGEKFQNEMTIKYRVNEDIPEGEVKLFGKEFVRNNKNNCILYIDANKQELCETFTYSQDEIDDGYLDVRIVEINPIKDMSYMFANCTQVALLPDIHKWDFSQVKDMRYIFSGCVGIVSFPDISLWNVSNVTNMSYMFSHCENLKNLPEISNWDTNKVNNMCCMFNYCSGLTKLPEISKWKMNNVINISYMFNGCSELKTIPDINLWNTSKVTNMSYLFYGCTHLLSLPDINSWDTSKVTNMSGMFFDCKVLRCLPDISEWNTSSVTNMRSMFSGCKEFTFLPDLKKWDISKTVNKSDMFNGCEKLPSRYIPYEFRK